MSTQIIIDLETTSTDAKAGILAVAIIAYSEKDVDKSYNELIENNSLVIKLDIREQLNKYGRDANKDTLGWWKKQGEEAMKILKPLESDISCTKVNDMIKEFCDKHNYKDGFIWQRGNMDLTWLDSMIHGCGQTPHLKWFKLRDIRTAIDVSLRTDKGYIPNMYDQFDEDFPGFIAHNPLHDIIRDIWQLRKIGIL